MVNYFIDEDLESVYQSVYCAFDTFFQTIAALFKVYYPSKKIRLSQPAKGLKMAEILHNNNQLSDYLFENINVIVVRYQTFKFLTVTQLNEKDLKQFHDQIYYSIKEIREEIESVESEIFDSFDDQESPIIINKF